MSNLVQKVCAVMADVGAISKDRENAHFRYNYVSAEAVRAKVQKACVRHGLVLRLTYEQEEVTAGLSVMKCACSVSEDGSTFVHLGDGWGAGSDKGDKSPMKACTAAAKYALANAFCIALGDDPEADESTDRDSLPISASVKRYAYGEEEQARADAQGARTGSAIDGLAADFAEVGDVEDAVLFLEVTMPQILTLPAKAQAVLGKRLMQQAQSIGLSADDFRSAWKAEVSKAKKERQQP